MIPKDPKARFSDRAEDYRKHRPSYPCEIADFLKAHVPITQAWHLADIGSGTGISSDFLLHHFQCHVHGVEPNAEMRRTAEGSLGHDPFFHSVCGSAETTSLPEKSVEMVTAFQSFHWFDRDKTLGEFHRILKSPKWILFVWNERQTDANAFLRDYENLQKQLPDYIPSTIKKISHRHISNFMGTHNILTFKCPFKQTLDIESLKGRFLSSSYTPKEGTLARWAEDKLEGIFRKNEKGGAVDFIYTTQLYLGKLLA